MSTAPMPRPASAKSAPPVRFPLSAITGKGSGLPNRYILHAVEGWGKTSWAAQAPKPVFLETRQETGLETLIDAGQLPDVPHFPELQTWAELLGAVDTLIEEPHEFRTLVTDTVNGAERMCHEHVCHRDYGDDWGDHGFTAYQKGFEVSLADWRTFLGKLDTLREKRRMSIVLLCHTKVGTFKNPEGPDYDRYMADMNQKTWALTHKWADVVLFGNFESTVLGGKMAEGEKAARKGKAIGGQYRMMYTERHASYDAKNRLGLPPEIEMGNSPAEAWQAFMTAVKAGKGQQ